MHFEETLQSSSNTCLYLCIRERLKELGREGGREGGPLTPVSVEVVEVVGAP